LHSSLTQRSLNFSMKLGSKFLYHAHIDPLKVGEGFFTLNHYQLWNTVLILFVLSQVSQAIIINETYFYGNVILGEWSVQYSFGKGRTPPLMEVVIIILCVLIYIPSRNPFSIRFLVA
jgi:hypothetical protein